MGKQFPLDTSLYIYDIFPHICFLFTIFIYIKLNWLKDYMEILRQLGEISRWSKVGGCLNIKMSSYQYRDTHVKDQMVLRMSNH